MRRLSTVASFSILSVAMVAICFSHAKLNQAMDNLDSPLLPPSLLPTTQAVRLVSLGFDQVVVDYYWLAFIGYIGDTNKRKVDHYALADKYLALITGLDPQFVEAYWFATFTVGGDQNRPMRAQEIIDFGIESNPNNWYLPFIGGVNQYLYAHDEVATAKYYRMASKYPDAPDWLERQAKIIEAKAPRLIKEAYSWLNIYESAKEQRVKEHAGDRSVALWAQVFKSAPDEAVKSKARQILNGFGVDIDAIARGR